jgi:hypothetical protein
MRGECAVSPARTSAWMLRTVSVKLCPCTDALPSLHTQQRENTE